MSRLLLYHPKQLPFKPYIANIDEYCDEYSLYNGYVLPQYANDAIFRAKKCGRLDIVEKLSCFINHSFHDFFDFLGRYVPYYRLPKYIVNTIKGNSWDVVKSYTLGSFATKNIDNLLWIYKLHNYWYNIVHFIEEINFNNHDSDQVNYILRVAMGMYDNCGSKNSYLAYIIENLRLLYNKFQAKNR